MRWQKDLGCPFLLPEGLRSFSRSAYNIKNISLQVKACHVNIRGKLTKMVSPCPVEMAVIQESASMDNLVDVQINFVLKLVKEPLAKPQHNISTTSSWETPPTFTVRSVKSHRT